MSRLYALPTVIVAAFAFGACKSDLQSLPSSSPSLTFSTTTIAFTNRTGDRVELTVEIADTPPKRERGLMFRESLPEDHGMIFKFESETKAAFWMKDTKIPLSIAFISADGHIVDILDMEPLSTTLHTPSHQYLTAVEVNQGWFTRNSVELGSVVHLS